MKGTFNQIKNSYEEYRKMFEGWTHFFEIYDYKPKIVCAAGYYAENPEFLDRSFRIIFRLVSHAVTGDPVMTNVGTAYDEFQIALAEIFYTIIINKLY